MNVIIDYLETMFSAYPQTPRLLEAKTELRAMMEDAYAELIRSGATANEAVGRVITDFGNLDELAIELGISSEIAATSAPVATDSPPAGQPIAPGQHPPVTMDEAIGFAKVHKSTRFRFGATVALFVVSPIPLLILIALDSAGILPLAKDASVAIGVIVLLLIAAVGVVLFVGIAGAFSPYTRLQRGRFAQNPDVTRWADELAQTHEALRTRAFKTAMLLWVLSPIPILAAVFATVSQLPALKDSWIVASVPLTLLLVAIGLLVLLPTAWARSVADTLNRAGFRDS
ncbi:MAG: permease prefix domain 1-containing protein [Microbacterium sp.]|uniref:permease prefix domain 1-containing protein n=1 Tax=Microbacterium sp. TaxID=51671 RepID=UPI003F9719C7